MYDYLIIGQGIAGSILAYKLMAAGQKIYIIDNSPPDIFSKSSQFIAQKNNVLLKHADSFYPVIKTLLGENYKPKVIGGLISPITGKRFSETWMAEILLPYAYSFYKKLEENLHTTFYKSMPIVRIFVDAKQANDWSVKSTEQSIQEYIDSNYVFENNRIHHPFGYAVFKQGAVVDGAKMLFAFYTYFRKNKMIISCSLHTEDVQINSQFIEWQEIRAKAVIFCEGWKAIENPLFNWLPFMPAKGELLIIKSPDLKLQELVNRGIFIRPLMNDLYLVGSTYTWDDLTATATQKAREEICAKLNTVIKADYKIIEQLAGIRPTVKGRRPFLGKHPDYENVFILNGLGTKGLLLAPYFAQQLTDHLLLNQELLPEVNIKRFS